MRYAFEWNPSKAKEIFGKHHISFERAATVFVDPSALSIFDLEHEQDEERWITLGIDSSGSLLAVVHTFHQVNDSLCKVRLISARKATKTEAQQYQEENL